MQTTPIYDLEKTPHRYLFGLDNWEACQNILKTDFDLNEHEITTFLCGRHGYMIHDFHGMVYSLTPDKMVDYMEDHIVQMDGFFKGDMNKATLGYDQVSAMMIEKDMLVNGLAQGSKYKYGDEVDDDDLDYTLPRNYSIRNFSLISRLQLALVCAIVERKRLNQVLEDTKIKQLVRTIEASKLVKNFGEAKLLTILKKLNNIAEPQQVIPFIINFEKEFKMNEAVNTERTEPSTQIEGNPDILNTQDIVESESRKKMVKKAIKEVKEKVEKVEKVAKVKKPDQLIKPLTIDENGRVVNPRKDNTHGHRSFNIIAEHFNATDPSGAISQELMTVIDYKQRGGRSNDLAWDVEHKFVELIDIVG